MDLHRTLTAAAVSIPSDRKDGKQTELPDAFFERSRKEIREYLPAKDRAGPDGLIRTQRGFFCELFFTLQDPIREDSSVD